MSSKFRARIEAQMANQLRLRTQELWKLRKGEKKLPFVTISREYGCDGYPVAEALQDKLTRVTDDTYPWAVFDKQVISKIAEEHNLSEALANSLSDNQRSQMEQYMDHIFLDRPNEYKIFQFLTQALIGLAEKGNAILIGRGGCIITREVAMGFNVRLIAPFEFRKEKIMRDLEISEDEAMRVIKKTARERESFVERYTLKAISDPYNFHLVLNNALHSVDEMAEIIVQGLRVKKYI